MTDPTPENSAENAGILPGFETITPPTPGDGPNVRAVAAVVQRLNSAGVLTADHDDYVQAALTLAGYVDRLPAGAKPYAVAQLMGQHLVALKALHPAPGELDTAATAEKDSLARALDAILEDDAR